MLCTSVSAPHAPGAEQPGDRRDGHGEDSIPDREVTPRAQPQQGDQDNEVEHPVPVAIRGRRRFVSGAGQFGLGNLRGGVDFRPE